MYGARFLHDLKLKGRKVGERHWRPRDAKSLPIFLNRVDGDQVCPSTPGPLTDSLGKRSICPHGQTRRMNKIIKQADADRTQCPGAGAAHFDYGPSLQTDGLHTPQAIVLHRLMDGTDAQAPQTDRLHCKVKCSGGKRV